MVPNHPISPFYPLNNLKGFIVQTYFENHWTTLIQKLLTYKMVISIQTVIKLKTYISVLKFLII